MNYIENIDILPHLIKFVFLIKIEHIHIFDINQ